jgi:predicted transcriptional regulator
VNVAIVLLLLPVFEVSSASAASLATDPVRLSLLSQLLVVNVFLVVFNLVPAFPMDGGRVFRAVLAIFMDYARATNVAVRVGQGMAILFGVIGLLSGQIMLALIGVFVFFGAGAEGRMVQMRSRLRGLRAADAMSTDFQWLTPDVPVRYAAALLGRTYQSYFPIFAGGELVGVLGQDELGRALEAGDMDTSLASVMQTNLCKVSPDAPLDDVFLQLQASEAPVAVVVQGGAALGLLTIEDVGRWITLAQFRPEPAAVPVARTGPQAGARLAQTWLPAFGRPSRPSDSGILYEGGR